MKKNKIIFITPYIGKYPWYFPYFLKTAAYNPDVDFKILSDADIPLSVKPDNVELIPYSLEQFNKDATKALSFNINVEKGYKLCDFKPAYGYIFHDYVKDYDFWGYCDIDIIFGNIRSFMTEELLSEYDVISARHDYLTGCFALYRNNQEMRELFKQSKDYQKVFTQPGNFFFDETNFAFDEFAEGLHYSQIHTEIESMTHVVRRLQEEKKVRAYFEFQIVEGFAGNMLWDKGTLIYRGEYEAMLYHLVRFKRKYSMETDINDIVPDRFRIGKRKIYLKEHDKSATTLSFCITCKNRMWQIKQTLPQNLKDNASMKGKVDFILVDFGSTDGLKKWVVENFKQEIEEDYLKFYYTDELEYWHASIAKNTAHALSESDIVVNLDCDNFTGEDGGKFVLDNMLEYGIENVIMHQLSGIAWDGSNGRIALSKEVFMNLGGYDESFEPMGFQDCDLLLRASTDGAIYLHLEDRRYNKTIRNDRSDSIKYTGSSISWEEMDRRNRLLSERNQEEGNIIANKGKQSIGISKNIYRVR